MQEVLRAAGEAALPSWAMLSFSGSLGMELWKWFTLLRQPSQVSPHWKRWPRGKRVGLHSLQLEKSLFVKRAGCLEKITTILLLQFERDIREKYVAPEENATRWPMLCWLTAAQGLAFYIVRPQNLSSSAQPLLTDTSWGFGNPMDGFTAWYRTCQRQGSLLVVLGTGKCLLLIQSL